MLTYFLCYFQCVRFEKFRGYPSEEAMIEDAIVYLENNTLWAGKVNIKKKVCLFDTHLWHDLPRVLLH